MSVKAILVEQSGGVTNPETTDNKVTSLSLSSTDIQYPSAKVVYNELQSKSNPNLLDNWYFVGGGSQQGGGQFPINQRGQTSYTGAGYGIDRWRWWQTTLEYSLTPSGIRFNDSGQILEQKIEPALSTYMVGRTVTMSCLTDSECIWMTFVWSGQYSQQRFGTGVGVIAGGSVPGFAIDSPVFIITTVAANQTIKAVKLELGDTQTLAHQDANGNWVLNEIPNYQEQLFRCQTSKADASDTYANKTNVVDNYYVRPNLLDNWYFVGGGSQQGGGQFPINQRNGYVVPPDTPYYPDTNLSGRSGTVSDYTAVQYVNTTYGTISINGTTYYVKYAAMVPGYAGTSYGIDRWKVNIVGSMTLERDGLLVSNLGTKYGGLWQESERFILSRATKYTFSALLSSPEPGWFIELHLVNATTGVIFAVGSTQGTSATDGIISITVDAPPVTDSLVYWRVLLCNSLATTSTCKLIAVKLELGDKQTLAHQENGVWVLNEIPNYQEQLFRCQRYQWVPSTGTLTYYSDSHSVLVGIGNTFPVKMRNAPTMRFINDTATFEDIYTGVKTILTSLPSNIKSTPEKHISLYAYTPVFPSGEYYTIVSDVIFDANL